MKKEIGIFVLLVVLCAVTGIEKPAFFFTDESRQYGQ